MPCTRGLLALRFEQSPGVWTRDVVECFHGSKMHGVLFSNFLSGAIDPFPSQTIKYGVTFAAPTRALLLPRD